MTCVSITTCFFYLGLLRLGTTVIFGVVSSFFRGFNHTEHYIDETMGFVGPENIG